MLFPKFTVKSITFGYVMLFVIIYILEWIAFIIKLKSTQTSDKSQQHWNCILYFSGAKFTYAITRQAQVHRLLLPMFLHNNFFHLFWNVLSLFMIGFTVEKALGTWQRYTLLLIIGALGGNLFSAVVDPYDFGVGASTSLFACLGSLCVWFFGRLQGMGVMEYQYMLFFFIMVAFSLLNGFLQPGSNVDSWGHLGGFLIGIALSFIMLRG